MPPLHRSSLRVPVILDLNLSLSFSTNLLPSVDFIPVTPTSRSFIRRIRLIPRPLPYSQLFLPIQMLEHAWICENIVSLSLSHTHTHTHLTDCRLSGSFTCWYLFPEALAVETHRLLYALGALVTVPTDLCSGFLWCLLSAVLAASWLLTPW